MTLLAAAKLVIALGCLDKKTDWDKTNVYAINEKFCDPYGKRSDGTVESWVPRKCPDNDPKYLRAKANALEIDQRAEKECPAAITALKKAVGQ